MKKLMLLAIVATVAFAVWSVTDPGVQKRIEAERQAKVQADKQKRQESADAWNKWIEEAKRKTDERVKQANEPGFDDGFRVGFMAGQLTRSKTNIKPPAKSISDAAQQAIRSQNVAPDLHAGFERGFNAGWGFGWTQK